MSPTQDESDGASAILDELERAAVVEQRGAVLHEGQMIAKASRRSATSLVARGTAAGLSRE